MRTLGSELVPSSSNILCFSSASVPGNKRVESDFGGSQTRSTSDAPTLGDRTSRQGEGLPLDKGIDSVKQIQCLSELVDGFLRLSRTSRPFAVSVGSINESSIFDSGRAMLSIAGALAHIQSPHTSSSMCHVIG